MKRLKAAPAKEILERIEARKRKSERRNVTFRFTAELIDDFQRFCKEKKVTMTEVLEEYMREFLKG